MRGRETQDVQACVLSNNISAEHVAMLLIAIHARLGISFLSAYAPGSASTGVASFSRLKVVRMPFHFLDDVFRLRLALGPLS